MCRPPANAAGRRRPHAVGVRDALGPGAAARVLVDERVGRRACGAGGEDDEREGERAHHEREKHDACRAEVRGTASAGVRNLRFDQTDPLACDAMGSKIITKTDRAMEDRMLAVSADPEHWKGLQ